MKPYPLRFQPIFKQTLWGGRRLATRLDKSIGPESDYAESWELVDHGEDQSVVIEGPLAGRQLSQLIAEDPAWLLGPDARQGRFPLLLKYLDCNRVLSVQVHPNDEQAARLPQPDLGKTEAWYVIESSPDSLVYAGLNSGVGRDELRAAVDAGRTEELLHAFHPQPGDCLFIPAGTVHALGAGLLVAEIQQSSDTTFRLYDWNRIGNDGATRPLHITEALAVTDYDRGPVEPRRGNPEVSGLQSLVECDQFQLQLLDRGWARCGGDDKFHIVTIPRGSATLRVAEQEMAMSTGQTLLLPASLPSVEVGVAADSSALVMQLP